jgi:hypothetical protein
MNNIYTPVYIKAGTGILNRAYYKTLKEVNGPPLNQVLDLVVDLRSNTRLWNQVWLQMDDDAS